MSEIDAPVHTIIPRALDSAVFTPFGEVISLEGSPRLSIDLYSGMNALHGPVVLHADQTPEFMLFQVGYRGGEVRYMERHVGMTQTFIPLNGVPYICLVAPPDAPLVEGFPDFEKVEAFFVPGDVSLNIHRGTWHEPPFPTQDGQRFLITSQPDITRGLQTQVDENGEVHMLDVDKRNPVYRTGKRLHIVMPS